VLAEELKKTPIPATSEGSSSSPVRNEVRILAAKKVAGTRPATMEQRQQF
jgi:hypothetical protein